MRYAVALAAALLLATSAGAMGRFPPPPNGIRTIRPGGAPPVVPEPAALAVFGVGAAIVGYAIHRRRK